MTRDKRIRSAKRIKYDKTNCIDVSLSDSNSQLLLITESRKKMTYSLCGGDHQIIHCNKPHNGLGQIMTSMEQNNAMKDRYLIVEIQEDGKIILPKTLDEYNRMRESSL